MKRLLAISVNHFSSLREKSSVSVEVKTKMNRIVLLLTLFTPRCYISLISRLPYFYIYCIIDIIYEIMKRFPSFNFVVGNLAGLAGVGVICSPTSSAVNRDHNERAAITANTVAHELGHNIGFMHNTKSCGYLFHFK